MPLAILLAALAIGAFLFTLNPAAGTRMLLKIVQGEICKKDSKLLPTHTYARPYKSPPPRLCPPTSRQRVRFDTYARTIRSLPSPCFLSLWLLAGTTAYTILMSTRIKRARARPTTE